MSEVPDEQWDVDVAGWPESVHPALSAQLIVWGQVIGAKSRTGEHQREGDVWISGLNDAALEDDHAEQTAISRTLLIEQKIPFQDKPAAQVRRVSPSLEERIFFR